MRTADVTTVVVGEAFFLACLQRTLSVKCTAEYTLEYKQEYNAEVSLGRRLS